MPLFHKLNFLLTPLLISTCSHATPSNVDVELFENQNCNSSTPLQTLALIRGTLHAESGPVCYVYGDICYPSVAPFQSFVVSRIAIMLDDMPECFVYTYSDNDCRFGELIIQGISSAGPLYYPTEYPTGCVNQLVGQTPATAQSLRLICGIASQGPESSGIA